MKKIIILWMLLFMNIGMFAQKPIIESGEEFKTSSGELFMKHLKQFNNGHYLLYGLDYMGYKDNKYSVTKIDNNLNFVSNEKLEVDGNNVSTIEPYTNGKSIIVPYFTEDESKVELHLNIHDFEGKKLKSETILNVNKISEHKVLSPEIIFSPDSSKLAIIFAVGNNKIGKYMEYACVIDNNSSTKIWSKKLDYGNDNIVSFKSGLLNSGALYSYSRKVTKGEELKKVGDTYEPNYENSIFFTDEKAAKPIKTTFNFDKDFIIDSKIISDTKGKLNFVGFWGIVNKKKMIFKGAFKIDLEEKGVIGNLKKLKFSDENLNKLIAFYVDDNVASPVKSEYSPSCLELKDVIFNEDNSIDILSEKNYAQYFVRGAKPGQPFTGTTIVHHVSSDIIFMKMTPTFELNEFFKIPKQQDFMTKIATGYKTFKLNGERYFLYNELERNIKTNMQSVVQITNNATHKNSDLALVKINSKGDINGSIIINDKQKDGKVFIPKYVYNLSENVIFMALTKMKILGKEEVVFYKITFPK